MPYNDDSRRKKPTVGEKEGYTTSCANESAASGRKPCNISKHISFMQARHKPYLTAKIPDCEHYSSPERPLPRHHLGDVR